MPSAYPILDTLKTALAGVAGVATCKIGLEANMSPTDYPMVRIVPSRISDGTSLARRKIECLVYFGQPIHELSSGLEALYASLMSMESALLTAAIQSTSARYIETVLDEDRVDAYKLMALRLELQG